MTTHNKVLSVINMQKDYTSTVMYKFRFEFNLYGCDVLFVFHFKGKLINMVMCIHGV
jgi:hypothetical protein